MLSTGLTVCYLRTKTLFFFKVITFSSTVLFKWQSVTKLSRRMRWAGHVARMWEGRGVHRVLVGKPEGKRPLG
jgi:hypothetical protein